MHTAHKVRSKSQLVTVSGVRSPGGHPEDLTLTTGYIQAICIALPHLYTHTDTHADTHRFEKGGMFA